MKITRTPSSRRSAATPLTYLRTPSWQTCAGSTLGAGQASRVSSSTRWPYKHASGIPCNAPLGLVCGTWLSMCASIHKRPSGPCEHAARTPLQVPTAQEWSPPLTTGKTPSPTPRRTSSARRRLSSTIEGSTSVRAFGSGRSTSYAGGKPSAYARNHTGPDAESATRPSSQRGSRAPWPEATPMIITSLTSRPRPLQQNIGALLRFLHYPDDMDWLHHGRVRTARPLTLQPDQSHYVRQRRRPIQCTPTY